MGWEEGNKQSWEQVTGMRAGHGDGDKRREDGRGGEWGCVLCMCVCVCVCVCVVGRGGGGGQAEGEGREDR